MSSITISPTTFWYGIRFGERDYLVALDQDHRKTAVIIHCAREVVSRGRPPPPTNNGGHLLNDVAAAVERHHRAGRAPGYTAPT